MHFFPDKRLKWFEKTRKTTTGRYESKAVVLPLRGADLRPNGLCLVQVYNKLHKEKKKKTIQFV